MSAIEPNWPALLWVALLSIVCWHGVLTLAGFLPLATRAPQISGLAADLLLAGNGALVALLFGVTGLYGVRELRWTTLVIVSGLVILFTPPLYEALSGTIGATRTGLAVLACLEAALLVGFLVLGPRFA